MKRKINILQISPGVPPSVGGEEKCTDIIYKKVNKSVFNMKLLVGKKWVYRKLELPLIQCPTRGTPLNYIITFIKFLRNIKNASIIHFQYPNYLFPDVTYGLILLLASKLLRKPYIVHVHLILKFKSKFWLKLKSLYDYYFKSLLKSSRLILIPTKYSKSLLINRFAIESSKIFVLPNGIDKVFFGLKQSLKKSDGFSKIIYIGRFSEEKNIDKLITAVKKLPKNIKLHIYGSGEEAMALRNLADGHKNVIIEGRLASNDIQKAYLGTKLLVLPSSTEELPITILEALASGVPVLSTPLPSIKSHFKNTIFYTTGSVEDLVKRIPTILKQDLK